MMSTAGHETTRPTAKKRPISGFYFVEFQDCQRHGFLPTQG